jgi:RecB family endonuclease NucS
MNERYGPSEAWLRDAIALDPFGLLEHMHTLYQQRDSYADGVKASTEVHTDAGRIDVLLAWPGHLVIVECKRDRADEGAVAQVLRYAGAMARFSGPAQIDCVVAAQTFTHGARFAAQAARVVLIEVAPAIRCDYVPYLHASMDPDAAAALHRDIAPATQRTPESVEE